MAQVEHVPTTINEVYVCMRDSLARIYMYTDLHAVRIVGPQTFHLPRRNRSPPY